MKDEEIKCIMCGKHGNEITHDDFILTTERKKWAEEEEELKDIINLYEEKHDKLEDEKKELEEEIKEIRDTWFDIDKHEAFKADLIKKIEKMEHKDCGIKKGVWCLWCNNLAHDVINLIKGEKE